MLTIKQAEQIIYVNERMEETKKILLPHYIEEYGERYQDGLKKHLDNTHFFTDSLPDITFNTLKEFPSAFKSSRDYLLMEEEYEDYQKINKRLRDEMQDKLNKIFSYYFHLPLDKLKKLDMNISEILCIDSYSSEIQKLFDGTKISNSSKDNLRKYQEQYIKQCRQLGCSPITDSEIIDYLLTIRKKMEDAYHIQLTKQTKWGKRNIEYFLSEMEIYDKRIINLETFIQMVCKNLFLPENIKCHKQIILRDNAFKQRSFDWIIFPMIRSLDSDINHAFYHEMRHTVEIGCYFGEFYNMLNELRTDEHALKDKEILPPILKSQKGKFSSFYLKLLPYTYGLFQEYGSTFDEWIISNNVHEQERVLKPDLLEEFENFFSSAMNSVYTIQSISDSSNMKVDIMLDEKYAKTLADEMKEGMEKHLAKK